MLIRYTCAFIKRNQSLLNIFISISDLIIMLTGILKKIKILNIILIFYHKICPHLVTFHLKTSFNNFFFIKVPFCLIENSISLGYSSIILFPLPVNLWLLLDPRFQGIEKSSTVTFCSQSFRLLNKKRN